MSVKVWVEYPRGTAPREWPAEWVHISGDGVTLNNLPDVPPNTPYEEKPRILIMYETTPLFGAVFDPQPERDS